jgi:hypothetical protein
MSAITYYVVVPFIRDEDGNLYADEAIECPSSTAAAARARALAASKAGAIAFSRSGDPNTGEFTDAIVIARIGEVPTDLEALAG